MVSLNMGAQPVENALVAKYTPTRWRSRMYGIKFVLTLGVTSIGVVLVPVLSGVMGSLDLLFIAIGLFAFILGFGIEGYVLYLKYIIGEPFAMHIALLIFGVLLIVIGIQFFSLGLIGEMISNSNQDKETRIKKIYKA